MVIASITYDMISDQISPFHKIILCLVSKSAIETNNCVYPENILVTLV